MSCTDAEISMTVRNSPISGIGKIPGALALAAALVAAAFFGAGCEAMRDPDDSDLPWAETHSWETQPNLPQSMLN